MKLGAVIRRQDFGEAIRRANEHPFNHSEPHCSYNRRNDE